MHDSPENEDKSEVTPSEDAGPNGKEQMPELTDELFQKLQQEIEGKPLSNTDNRSESPPLQSVFDLDIAAALDLDLSELGLPGLIAYRVLGHGGMGVVLEAIEHRETSERRVAVKLIRPDVLDKNLLLRFRREQKLLAGIVHPHVARLYYSGVTSPTDDEPEGMPYFVMEFVGGQPLTTYCNGQKLNLRTRLELMIQICDAVQNLHSGNVVHRDLSPNNILVTDESGRPTVKLIDFGLAVEAPEGDFESDGAAAVPSDACPAVVHGTGTLPYMSPEQTGCTRNTSATPVSDIYALGTILFELIAGEQPGGRASDRDKAEVLESIAIGNQILLSEAEVHPEHCKLLGLTSGQLRRKVRQDLTWIVDQARRRSRSERYRSAEAMQTDLQAVLDHRPVSAHPKSGRYVVAKFVRRFPGFVMSTSLLIASLVLGLVVSLVLLRRATEAEKDARFESNRATASARREREARQKVETALTLSEMRGRNLSLAGKLLRDVFAHVGKDVPVGKGGADRLDPLAEGEILRRQLVAGVKQATQSLEQANLTENADFDDIRYGLAAARRLATQPIDADLLVVYAEKTVQDRVAIPQLRMLRRLMLATAATADNRFQDAERNIIEAKLEVAQAVGEPQAVQSTAKWITHIQANLKTAQGKYEDALRIREELHSVQVPARADDRHFYYANLQNIGVLLYLMERYEESVAALEEVVISYSRDRTSDDMVLHSARGNLASAYHKAGFDEAYVHMKRSNYLNQLKAMGPGARFVGTAKTDLAIALANTDRHVEALALFDEIVNRFGNGRVGLQAQYERAELLNKIGNPLSSAERMALDKKLREHLPDAAAGIEMPGVKPVEK